ncbi:MAG: rRNA maturation RNase YbeY [Acidobacteriota bacterium]
MASSFVLRFISDREMRRLNGTYRRQDRPTDVLSFPGDLEGASNDRGSGGGDIEHWRCGVHLGDVAISVPTARRQAQERKHALDQELRLLTLHGILHCLGYDHETDGGEMEELEAELRRRYFGEVAP